MSKLGAFVEELIIKVECYEEIFEGLKQTIDNNFINRNKNRTVYLTDIVKPNGGVGTSGIKRDITVIKDMQR
jgi:hypothetical protein